MYLETAEIKKFADETWAKVEKKMEVVAARTPNGFIPYGSEGSNYFDHSQGISWWTNGFWPGWMWLLYVGSKKEVFKERAEAAEEALDASLFDYDSTHHDVGFMWEISAGANYRITGNKKSRNRALFAAALLASRFNENGKFIRAWNGDKNGWAIIDCMMNIPLLYWASGETDDRRFKQIALAHADTTLANHLREDGSLRHIVAYDPENGEGYVDDFGGQGFEKGSAWSRGQAWALYGFVLSYIHTGEERFLNAAKKVANFFIASVADTGYLPLCDFRAPLEPVLYDSTAGACAACGLIEIAKALPENEGRIYINAAIRILKAMDEKFANYDENVDGILGFGCESYTKADQKNIIYGDYYFTEALYKLKNLGPLFE